MRAIKVFKKEEQYRLFRTDSFSPIVVGAVTEVLSREVLYFTWITAP